MVLGRVSGLCLMMAHISPSSIRTYCLRLIGIVFIVIGSFLVGTTEAQAVYSLLSGELAQTDMLCVRT